MDTESERIMTLEQIESGGEVLAIIVRHGFARPGVHFFTPTEFSQQLGYMQHPVGKIIQPHVHTAAPRAVEYTQEVLFIKKGRLRVDFYSREQQYLESRVLETGDVILLASAGHGFEVLEDLEMFEIKQGPYAEHADKVRFNGISSRDVVLGENKD
jgi:mannose-6-phosphate isomerase-like protein (cupin superfamily)